MGGEGYGKAQQVVRTEVTMSPIQVLFLPSLTTPSHLHNQGQERGARRLPGAQGLGWTPGSPREDIGPENIATSPLHC